MAHDYPSIREIGYKFKSGNDVKVTKATLTLEEWLTIERTIEAYGRGAEKAKLEISALKQKVNNLEQKLRSKENG